MTPVMMTRFDHLTGDAMSACVASVLELRLDEVPDFSPEALELCDEHPTLPQRIKATLRQDEAVAEFLKRLGRRCVSLYGDAAIGRLWVRGEVDIIGFGPSKRFEDRCMAVVCKATDDGLEVLHNPDPLQPFLGPIIGCYLIT